MIIFFHGPCYEIQQEELEHILPWLIRWNQQVTLESSLTKTTLDCSFRTLCEALQDSTNHYAPLLKEVEFFLAKDNEAVKI